MKPPIGPALLTSSGFLRGDLSHGPAPASCRAARRGAARAPQALAGAAWVELVLPIDRRVVPREFGPDHWPGLEEAEAAALRADCVPAWRTLGVVCQPTARIN